jgi:hypothetical protein
MNEATTTFTTEAQRNDRGFLIAISQSGLVKVIYKESDLHVWAIYADGSGTAANVGSAGNEPGEFGRKFSNNAAARAYADLLWRQS